MSVVLEQRAPRSAPEESQRPLRLAYFTPLNPLHSGISDHSEELLPFLGEVADVDIVTGPYRPSNDAIRDRFRILDSAQFLRERNRYDVAIYQVGNHLRCHAYMLPCMRAVPGIVMVQDFCLQYLVLGLTLGRGDIEAAARALAPLHGEEEAHAIARKLLFGLADPNAYLFVHPFLAVARAVGVHSEHARQLVLQMVPGARVENLPLAVAREQPSAPRAQLRRRHGLDDSDFVIASVSTRAPKKRLDIVIEALQRLRQEVPRAKLLVLGGGSPGQHVHQLVQALGLQERVVQTGWLEPDRYRELIRSSDIVVDLRETRAGETAHSVLRSLSLGTPAIVAARGPFLELPDDCCPKVDPDADPARALSALLARLHREPAALAAMRAAAAAFADANLGLDLQAREMVRFARSVAHEAPPPRPVELLGRSDSRPRHGIAAIYQVCRTLRLVRSYGAGDALRRLRLRLGSRLGLSGRETL
jgi:glycosyltransferase involved in cell wall biosynthesis